MIHLRIADKLLDRFDIEAEEFIMGNIAPDSGEPNEDETCYVPSKELSHYKIRGENGKSRICPEKFTEEYLTKAQTEAYTKRQYSFYLGYFVHLLTDVLWLEKVFKKTVLSYPEQANADMQKFITVCKADWYDQDHLFIKKNPDFRAFDIYKSIKCFNNTYIGIFSEKAFENKKAIVEEFYSEEHLGLDREYPYFSEEQAEAFVNESCIEISKQIKQAPFSA